MTSTWTSLLSLTCRTIKLVCRLIRWTKLSVRNLARTKFLPAMMLQKSIMRMIFSLTMRRCKVQQPPLKQNRFLFLQNSYGLWCRNRRPMLNKKRSETVSLLLSNFLVCQLISISPIIYLIYNISPSIYLCNLYFLDLDCVD